MALEITYGQFLGYDQVAAIENWLRDNISYIPGANDVQVTAIEVNARQWGVCRDMAHLGIALCRSLSIPARMVVGYNQFGPGVYPSSQVISVEQINESTVVN